MKTLYVSITSNETEEEMKTGILLVPVSEARAAAAEEEEAHRCRSAAVCSTDAQQDAQTPLPSADRRTKTAQTGSSSASLLPGAQPRSAITDVWARQSQTTGEERLSSGGQPGRGAGAAARRTADGFIIKVCSERRLFWCFYCALNESVFI